MRIKKDPIFKNEYIKTGDIWVRNFTNGTRQPIDLNQLFTVSDLSQIMINEIANRNFNRTKITDENLYFPNIVIISDGYDFEKKQNILSRLPSNVVIFAVNNTLNKWKQDKPINLYVTNNPYKDCMNDLPKRRYYPSCVASTRSYPAFLDHYKGKIYLYEPTPSLNFGIDQKDIWYIDDYRNPICAAIGLAYKFGVQKLALFCCDESFVDERPGAIKLNNELWNYPQHKLSHDIIDANLYWLINQENYEVKVVDYSSGLEYINATYISTEEMLLDFFENEN